MDREGRKDGERGRKDGQRWKDGGGDGEGEEGWREMRKRIERNE